jgi:ADP-ribosyl-[dinitrogen reductase] hydrolase
VPPRRSRAHYRGCLLGGAVGDALGAPVEFMSLDEIRRRLGVAGVTTYAPAYGRVGAITDDTQMTLFSAEALIRGHNRWLDRGLASLVRAGRRAYRRWLHTQGSPVEKELLDGWLVRQEGLHHRRAPGNTCLAALEHGTGTMEGPANDSKGCGGVMRVAPAGLAGVSDRFVSGCELAAITHGHPSGYLAAGAFAEIVYRLAEGAALPDAVTAARERLRGERGHEETLRALEQAVELARSTKGTPEDVEQLGGGWVAEEALAIGLYCALEARDFEHGVLLAVNHGGDSDSTGSIAGNLLGLMLGEDALPQRWLDPLELREVITEVADDLWLHFGEGEKPPGVVFESDRRSFDWDKYPGN